MGPQRRKSSFKLGEKWRSTKSKSLSAVRKKTGKKKLLDIVEHSKAMKDDADASRDDGAETNAGQTEEQKEQEEKKNKFPIAPDGYIPNSVVRKLLSIHLPQVTLPYQEPWRLKPCPPMEQHLGGKTSRHSENEVTLYLSDTSLSNPLESDDQDEALEEELEEEEEVRSETVVSRAELASRASTAPSEKRVTPKPEVSKKEVDQRTTRKKKPLSRQGTTTSAISEEEEEPDIPPLLRKIAKEPWFPKSVSMTVAGVSSAFTAILSNMTSPIHRKICDYILQIKEQLGFPDIVRDKLIAKLLDQLSSPNGVFRGNAIRTLGKLGYPYRDILVRLFPLLTDLSDDVRTDAQVALQQLTGVDNKDKLQQLMEELGVLQTYSSRNDEDEALKRVAENISGPPQPAGLQVLPEEMTGSRVETWLQDSTPDGNDVTDTDTLKDKRVEKQKPVNEAQTQQLSTPENMEKPMPKTPPKPRRKRGGPVPRSQRVFESRTRTPSAPKRELTRSQAGSTSPKVTQLTVDKEARGTTPTSAGSMHSRSRLIPTNTQLYKVYSNTAGPKDGSSPIEQMSTKASDDPAPALKIHADLSTLISSSAEQSDTSIIDGDLNDHQSVEHPSPVFLSVNPSPESNEAQKNKVLGSDSSNVIAVTIDHRKDFSRVPDSSGFSTAGTSRFTMMTRADHTGQQKTLVTEDSGLGPTSDEASTYKDKSGVIPVSSQRFQAAGSQLSPVHGSEGSEIAAEQDNGENWRGFFSRPTAQVRRRQQEAALELENDRFTKRPVNLPPIRYLGDDVELVTGDPGMRLLHSVTIRTKMDSPHGSDEDLSRKHTRIDPIPGKLGINTINHDSEDSYLRPQDKFLPSLPESVDVSPFEWARPLPPAPERDALLTADPVVRTSHKHYCEYYRLLKLRMHEHVSISRYLSNKRMSEVISDLSQPISSAKGIEEHRHVKAVQLSMY